MSILPEDPPFGFFDDLMKRVMDHQFFRFGLMKQSATLIIRGLAGVGKTTTMLGVVEKLQKRDEPVRVASAFFRHNKTDTHDAAKLFIIFIKQLVEQDASFAMHASSLHVGEDDVSRKLSDISSVFEKMIEMTARVCIILDGLDEFGNGAKRTVFMEHVKRIQIKTGVGVIITERSGGSVGQPWFSDNQHPKIWTIPLKAESSDVKNYIEFRLEADKSSWIAEKITQSPNRLQMTSHISNVVTKAATTKEFSKQISQPM